MSKEMRRPVYSWYIEPLDEHTNEVIARELAQECDAPERGRRCSDGKPHDLWRCRHILIERLRASRKRFNLRFRAYGQKGNGPIREWKLPKGRYRPVRTKILRIASQS